MKEKKPLTSKIIEGAWWRTRKNIHLYIQPSTEEKSWFTCVERCAICKTWHRGGNRQSYFFFFNNNILVLSVRFENSRVSATEIIYWLYRLNPPSRVPFHWILWCLRSFSLVVWEFQEERILIFTVCPPPRRRYIVQSTRLFTLKKTVRRYGKQLGLCLHASDSCTNYGICVFIGNRFEWSIARNSRRHTP